MRIQTASPHTATYVSLQSWHASSMRTYTYRWHSLWIATSHPVMCLDAPCYLCMSACYLVGMCMLCWIVSPHTATYMCRSRARSSSGAPTHADTSSSYIPGMLYRIASTSAAVYVSLAAALEPPLILTHLAAICHAGMHKIIN
jgi:hypothetical protein